MKKYNLFLATVLTLLVSFNAIAQDNRTLETKIADLLVQMPADNLQLKDKLMKEMEGLGNEALNEICSRIIPPGTGNDTPARYAVESYSRHLSLSKNEQLVNDWESICLNNVESNSNRFVKAFFMHQLDYVGSAKTIDGLAKYLTDKDLSAQAIKAMYMTDPKKASALFAEKLPEAQGRPLIGLINAIGNSGQAVYAPELVKVYSSNDDAVRLAVLSALSKLENPASLSLLKKEAAAAGYNPDKAKATESLLKYYNAFHESNKKESIKIAKTILKKSSTLIYRIDAQLLLASCYTGNEKTEILVKGMKEKDKSFRGAMVEEAIESKTASAPWIRELKKSKDPEIQKEILYLLAGLKDKSVAEDIKPFVNNKNADVRGEALMTYAILKYPDAVKVIVNFMKLYTSQPDQKNAFNALSITMSKDNADILINAFNGLTPQMKVVALNIFGERRITGAIDQVMQATKSDDKNIAGAAYSNLKYTATEKNLDVLLEKFDKCKNPGYKKDLSEAIVAVVKAGTDKQALEKKVLAFAESKGNMKDYIGIYAGLGGTKAVKAVSNLYKTGDQKTKEAALKALANWSDDSALSELFYICSNDYPEADKKTAFRAYVGHVAKSSMPDDEKLLLLRKIMPYASTVDEKKMVIKTLGNVKTFLCYVFLKQYLDDAELKNDAANSLMKVILPSNGEDNGLVGKDVKETLEKVKELITGPDSQYFKIDIDNYLASMGDEVGYVSMFNGKDLTGWQGFVANPIKKKQMSSYKRMKLQETANKKMHENWSVKNGTIVFSGKGANLCSVKEDYGDFEMIVDWRITKKGDSGIYLRGTPQVQIWDTSRVEVGAQVGSGGLYNNKAHESKPLVVADNPIGDWNTFRIKMVGDRVTVYLNGQLVVDNVVMDNYWDRSLPIFPKGPIELQAHGTNLAFRDIYIKELKPENHNQLTPEEKKEGFKLLFNGKNLDGWVGNKTDYKAENGMIVIKPRQGSHGNLYTQKEYKNFIFRFEFKLTPGANNGLGIHAPLKGDAAYEGIELQILDNDAEVYANLKPYQYHGSVYGVIPAKRGYLKPVGEWNTEEVVVNGTHIKITLNGHVILDGDYAEASKNGTLDHKDHPGLKRETGHIGFLGHGSVVYFRDIRIKEL